MAKPNLEALSVEELQKKHKAATSLLIILLVFYVVCIISMLVFKPFIAATITPLLVTLLPIALGRKKIKEELKKRGITD